MLTGGAHIRSRLSLKKAVPAAPAEPAAATAQVAAQWPLADITSSLRNQEACASAGVGHVSPLAGAGTIVVEPQPALEGKQVAQQEAEHYGGEDDDDLPCFDLLDDGYAAVEEPPGPDVQGEASLDRYQRQLGLHGGGHVKRHSRALQGPAGVPWPGDSSHRLGAADGAPADAASEPGQSKAALVPPITQAAPAAAVAAPPKPAGEAPGSAYGTPGPAPMSRLAAASRATAVDTGVVRASGGFEGLASLGLITQRSSGSGGRTARRSQLRSQRKYKSLFGEAFDQEAVTPALQKQSAAAAEGEDDLLDVPWVSGKKLAQQQQQQQQVYDCAAATLTLDVDHGDLVCQPSELPPLAAPPAMQQCYPQHVLQEQVGGQERQPWCEEPLQRQSPGQQQDQPLPASADGPIPDSEEDDDEEEGWEEGPCSGGASHQVPAASGLRARLQRLVRAGSLPQHAAAQPAAAAAAAAAGQVEPECAAGVHRLGITQKGLYSPDVGPRVLAGQEQPSSIPRSGERPALNFKQSVPGADATALAPPSLPRPSAVPEGSRPESGPKAANPFARPSAKTSRVVLAAPDPWRSASASGAAPATAVMVQSVLDSLPRRLSPLRAQPPLPSDSTRPQQQQGEEEPRRPWQRHHQHQQPHQHQPWHDDSGSWEQQEEDLYAKDGRVPQPRGQGKLVAGPHGEPLPHRGQQQWVETSQREQQQQEQQREQGQMLTWAEQSRQYGFQEQSRGGWQMPAWFANDAGPQHVPEAAEQAPHHQQQQQLEWQDAAEDYQRAGFGGFQNDLEPQQQHNGDWYAEEDVWQGNERHHDRYQQQQQQQQRQQHREQEQPWRQVSRTRAEVNSEEEFEARQPRSQARRIPASFTQPTALQLRQQPAPGRQQQQHHQQQQQQQRWQDPDVINLVNSPPPSQPRHLVPGNQRAGTSSISAAGPPWWHRLPDLVPVQVLAQQGKNPRDGSVVYIDYARQFTGATGGGVTAAARKAARQQGPLDGTQGALTAGTRPKARKGQGQQGRGTQAGGSGVGHWESAASGGKVYVNAQGRRIPGQRGYLEYCKETGKDLSRQRGSERHGGSGGSAGGEGGKRKRRSGGRKRARKK